MALNRFLFSQNGASTSQVITSTASALNSLVASSGVPDGDKGDITVSASGATWTIDNSAVTYAKIQNVSATDILLGRSTAGAGVVEEIACTSAGRALLDDANAAAQLTTLGVSAAAQTVLDDATVSDMVDTLGGASATGTGGLVRTTSPTLVTPVLGAASATSLSAGTLTATTGATVGGNATAAGYIDLLEDSDNGAHKVRIQAPASLAADITLTLPTGDGDANQALVSDGNGNLSFASVGAAGLTAASASGPTTLDFYEDTDNGTNYVRVSGVSSVASNKTLTLPDATGYVVYSSTDSTGTVTLPSHLSAGQIQSVGNPMIADSGFYGPFCSLSSSTTSGYVRFYEDTDNGSSYIDVKPATALSANYTLTLPSATGTLALAPSTGTGTCTTNAVTINTDAGVVTTESLTTAAGASQAITLTNSVIGTGDMVFVQHAGGTNTINNISFKAVTGSGSATITIYNNHASSALDGTVIFNFRVVQA